MQWKNDRAIFLQVVDFFKHQVINGEYKPGDKVASVRDYALKLDINPNTVVKVYEILTNQGLIEAKSTNGYFLTSNEEIIKNLKREFVILYQQEFLLNMSRIGINKEEAIEILKGEL